MPSSVLPLARARPALPRRRAAAPAAACGGGSPSLPCFKAGSVSSSSISISPSKHPSSSSALLPRAAAARGTRRGVNGVTARHPSAVAAAVAAAGAQATTTLLLFNLDLRVDDHPGLAEAVASGGGVVPVFVACPRRLAAMAPDNRAALASAVHDLRASLRALGSDLVVRGGDPAEVVPIIAAQAGATEVVAQDEVEHAARAALEAVEGSLPPGVPLRRWRLALWAAQEGQGGLPEENYRRFVERRGAALPPVGAPVAVPPLPVGLEPGDMLDFGVGGEGGAEAMAEADVARRVEEYLSGGLAAAAADAEARENNPGASFDALFGDALLLGKVSPRRVAAAVDVARAAGGLLQDLGLAPRDPHAAANRHIASIDAARKGPSGAPPRYWSWQGLLTSYTVAGPEDGQPVLLVHGFGAFSEHFRYNIDGLAARGFRVYAATFPGFGRSEKIRRGYSQYSWTEFLRAFVAEVVGRPVVVCGNSIGGFMSASLAGDHPELVEGLVLMNSAGQINPDYVLPEGGHPMSKDSKPPRVLIELAGRGLLLYLESNIGKILKRCYPKNPDMADEWLSEEIFRASCDPGALGVFQSGAYLPPPRPINYLIDEFAKPVMVLQGRFDPLNDAVGRAESLLAASPANVRVEWVEAGHCPHDEAPEFVNDAIAAFAREVAGASAAPGGAASRLVEA